MDKQKKMTVEESLKEHGFYIAPFVGKSMLPLIRPQIDRVIVTAYNEEHPLKKMDIVLYYGINDVLTFHRVIGFQENDLEISGDNCTFVEHVPYDKVIGVFSSFYRDGKEYFPTHWLYRFYVAVWCRPYRLRILFLKIGRRLQRKWFNR